MNKFYFLLEQKNIAPAKIMVVAKDGKKVLLERKLPYDNRFEVRCVNGYLNYLETKCKVDLRKLIMTETDWYKEWNSYLMYVAKKDLIPVDNIIDFAFSYSVLDETELDAS